MRLYIDDFKGTVLDQNDQLNTPLQPGHIKSNEGLSEMSNEMIEVKQALLRGKALDRLDKENQWPNAFLKLVHPQEEKKTPGLRKK